MEGERIEWIFEQQTSQQGRPVAAVRSAAEQMTPTRRLVTAADVARTVAFLASDESAGVTGDDVKVTADLVMY